MDPESCVEPAVRHEDPQAHRPRALGGWVRPEEYPGTARIRTKGCAQEHTEPPNIDPA
jgi:hypothetical protein